MIDLRPRATGFVPYKLLTPELQAEAALDRAHSAWIEAESHLLRLCANVEVEVAHAV